MKRVQKKVTFGFIFAVWLSVTPVFAQITNVETYNTTPADASPVSAQQVDAVPQSSTQDVQARLAELEKYVSGQEAAAIEKKKKDAKKPTVTLGGRLHIDTAGFSQNEESKDFFDAVNGTEFRRARLCASGNYMEQFNYKMEIDFRNGGSSGVAMKDVYAEIIKLPVLSDIRVGHFKEGFSLDHLTSSNTIWFMERSSVANTFGAYVGDRSMGAAIGNASQKKNTLWNVGLYENVSDPVKYEFDKPHGYGLAARAAHLFYEDEESGTYFHLGGAYSFKGWDETGMNFSAKPEMGLAPSTLKTDAILGTTSYNAFTAEMIGTWRSFGVQSELYFLNMNNVQCNNPCVWGGYIQVGYWLTGEHYTYEKGRGILGRVQPNDPFAKRCENGILFNSIGAWQLVYRYSRMDLSELPEKMSGTMGDHTIGLNWHMTAHTRIMLDYVFSDSAYSDGRHGTVNAIGCRYQLDF